MLNISNSTSLIIVLIAFFGHWYLSLFTQSFFHHRYAAHMQFTMNKFWEKVFFILSYLFQGSSYLSPRAYGILHRLHHAFTDTEKDPHSPKFMPGIGNMMWQTKEYYDDIYYRRITIDPKYLKHLPIWESMDKLGQNYASRIAWGLAYIAFYVLFATQWWMYLLLPIHFLMGPFHGVIVNWFAHKIGYTNYNLNNTSTNLINIDFLMWGESLHNNHHKYPANANFATKWFEFDPMYPIIKVMDWLGIIKLKTT